MKGLKKAGIELDRKVLSDIADQDAAGCPALVEKAKAAPAAAKAVLHAGTKGRLCRFLI
jgi:large subunit ribosomal protein L20